MHRRLPALAINLGTSLQKFWREQFQGTVIPHDAIDAFAAKAYRIENGSERLEIVYIDSTPEVDADTLYREVHRVLKESGIVRVFPVQVMGRPDSRTWR